MSHSCGTPAGERLVDMPALLARHASVQTKPVCKLSRPLINTAGVQGNNRCVRTGSDVYGDDARVKPGPAI